MDHRTIGHAVALFVLLSAAALPAAALTAGAVDAMQRIPRSGSVVTSDRVHLYVARNETEPFQVVISAPADAPLHEVALTLEPLKGLDGKLITEIAFYRQHYVTVTTSSPFAPLPPGDYPDALIPFHDPVTGNSLEGTHHLGAPFHVAAGENQPIWVDIHVPSSTPPGEYRGNLTITQQGKLAATLPVIVTVWDFQLPTVPALGSDFGLSRQRVAVIHGLDPERDAPTLNRLVRRYYDLLLDHRLSPGLLFDASPAATETGAPDFEYRYPGLGSAAEGLTYYLGKRNAASYSYALWENSPFENPLGSDRERLLNYLTGYARFLEQHGWSNRAHLPYGFLDEPASAKAYATIRDWGQLAQEVEQRAGVSVPLMITEQPQPDNPQWGSLQGFVDIWVPSFNAILQDERTESPAIPARLEAGEQLWAYTALSYLPGDSVEKKGTSHPPKWLIDFHPINYRLPAWLAPLYGVSGLLYWDTLWWEEGVNIWQDAGNYLHRDPDDPEGWGEVLNGEGLLIYPGHKKEIGFDGPIASIRLKWLREAVEDFAYIHLLKEHGEWSFARQQIRRFARGMDDWENRPDQLYAARWEMGEKLTRILGRHQPTGNDKNELQTLLEKVEHFLHPIWLR